MLSMEIVVWPTPASARMTASISSADLAASKSKPSTYWCRPGSVLARQ